RFSFPVHNHVTHSLSCSRGNRLTNLKAIGGDHERQTNHLRKDTHHHLLRATRRVRGRTTRPRTGSNRGCSRPGRQAPAHRYGGRERPCGGRWWARRRLPSHTSRKPPSRAATRKE